MGPERMRSLARPQGKLGPSFPSNRRSTGGSGIPPELVQPGAVNGGGDTGDSGVALAALSCELFLPGTCVEGSVKHLP